MSPKATRIPGSVWNGYKEEIIALYTAPGGTLPKVTEKMKEKHGFQPTKSQYTTKLKDWGLQKYLSATEYTYADQKIKKRALEGKDTAFNARGKKISRKDMEGEIGRNTTLTSRLQYVEDIPTPEGIQVFTPPSAEVSPDSVTLEANIDNFPWSRMHKDFHAHIVQVFQNQIFQSTIYNMLDSPRSQLDILHNPQFGVKMLQMALGGAMNLEDSNTFILLTEPKTRKQKRRYLASYFPPRDDENDMLPSPFRSMDLGMPPQIVALQILLQYFICLTNNDVLEDSHLFNAVNWLLKVFDRPLFTYIFSLRTTTSKIFMRKILPASVNSGNTKLVGEILDRSLPSKRVCNYGLPWFSDDLQETCITIAIQNGNQRMLELLCTAGFHPRFRLGEGDTLLSRKILPWNRNNRIILRTLIDFNADPDCMLTDVERGFPLVNAAESGNLEAVNMLLEAGSRVNVYVKNYFGTPLQAAVHAEQYDMVKFLIEEGADVNAPYGEQYKQACWRWPNSDHLHDMIQKSYQCIAKTPIQIACQINNIPLFELLLGHGALVNLSPLSHITAEKCIKNAMFDTLGDYNSPGYKTIPYHTALQYSVYNRNLFLVRRLLSLDITRPNPDSRVISNWGDTPLQMAARLNYPEIVSVLIANGADVNAPPGWINGRTALQAAAESGNIEMVQLFLLRNADVNAPAGYERGLTALQAALRNGHPEIVELLLRSNADIHAPPSPHHGLSTIAAATSRGNLPMLKFLMENGSEEGDSMPAICAAANYGWVEGARYLLQQGSDANSIYDDLCEDYYDCPLLSSIMNGDLEMMELLLEFGVNFKLPVKPKSGAHEDALCMVLYERCPPEIILLLCHHYAKLGPDSLAEKTLALAVTYTYYKQDSTMILTPIQVIMSGLSEASYSERVARAWADLSHYIWDEHDELDEDQILLCFKFLLEMGADINMGVEFATVLQIAIWSGKMKLARYILEQGAEIQVPAAEFVGTPLQEAILKEELELAYTFLERGADVNALPSSKGGTALQAAAETGNINIAVELLRRGARVAADNGGGTAINTAAVFGREDMLQLLLNHYDGDEDLWHVCLEAAHDAEVIGHLEIAEWLRGYAVPSVQKLDDNDLPIFEPEPSIQYMFRQSLTQKVDVVDTPLYDGAELLAT